MKETLPGETPKKIILIEEGRESEFGLTLRNADKRRKIYEITDEEKFLSQAAELGIGSEISKIEEIFALYPGGLKQFFTVMAEDEKIVLGKHYHEGVEKNGAGVETFIFTEVPAGSKIKFEKYSLGRSKGKILYDVRRGAVVENRPKDYHVFTCEGPFSMVQVTVAAEFKGNDLHKFESADWSEGDKRFIEGRPDFRGN